ncbi:hypothetical protein N7468_005625 [Penicillium chermesinum]|uniref:Uncharacterized protein n=1 Tax=Penicillium chermesinum TaxID=63820 RepID=A0A9W9NZD8_9EURO|nr:uncharacterized protein N7468_005625 [Penicillium chermesinum]KAJ5232669.1 hypothetical protein N7468_005625 [Penicillium chermesinum]KAJ6172328.1 hypothetical protein N7470_001395 [Penicillium chermesinum]
MNYPRPGAEWDSKTPASTKLLVQHQSEAGRAARSLAEIGWHYQIVQLSGELLNTFDRGVQGSASDTADTVPEPHHAQDDGARPGFLLGIAHDSNLAAAVGSQDSARGEGLVARSRQAVPSVLRLRVLYEEGSGVQSRWENRLALLEDVLFILVDGGSVLWSNFPIETGVLEEPLDTAGLPAGKHAHADNDSAI